MTPEEYAKLLKRVDWQYQMISGSLTAYEKARAFFIEVRETATTPELKEMFLAEYNATKPKF